MFATYEVLMGTHNCAVCSEPVDLTVDRCDETGDPVHKQCYLGRITGKSVAATPIPRAEHHSGVRDARNSGNQLRPHAAFVDASVRTSENGGR
jgi:hypothetical protein